MSCVGLDYAKCKKVTRSNWSKPLIQLNNRQLQYAANDAKLALLIYNEWAKHPKDHFKFPEPIKQIMN